jgi:hypothetical protein
VLMNPAQPFELPPVRTRTNSNGTSWRGEPPAGKYKVRLKL